jgi:hypothetical protein
MNLSFDVEIESEDRHELAMEMLGTNRLTANEPVAILDGVTASWSAPLKKYASEPNVFHLAVSLVRDVGVGIWQLGFTTS